MWQLGGHRLLAPAVGLRATSTAAVSSCRAVMLPRFGGPEVREVLPAVGVPSLKPRDVLVRSRAVSINPLDLRDASAIPFAALTAWRALKSTARITNGQRLLVLGGGGAVGLAAIQIAVAAVLSVTAGCSVSATCGSQSIERVLAFGAEQAIDYTAEDIEVAIKGQFDAVLDAVGVPETERTGINLLKKGGHYMMLQAKTASLADKYGLVIGIPAATTILLKKQLQYRYSHGIEYWWTYMRADAEGLDEIRRLSEAGKLKIPVEETFPIAKVRKAHEVKVKRIIPGKMVLEVD
ncbi:unnamed protein product [Musa acuminata subsp. burmannicoides]